MKKNKMYIFVVFTLITTLFIACRKDIEQSLLDGSLKNRSAFRKTNNDRLSFNSMEDLHSYYDELEELLKSSNGDVTSADLLLKKEVELGFTSLRSNIYKEELDIPEFNGEHEDFFPDVFIKDEIRQSILNPYYEVEVSDKVYVYLNENIMLEVNKEDNNAIDIIRTIKKGAEYEELPNELSDLDINVISNILKIEKWGSKIPNSFKTNTITRTLITENIEFTNRRATCDIYLKYFKIHVGNRVVQAVDDKGTASTSDDETNIIHENIPYVSGTINYGDGTIEPIYNNTEISHEYSTNGTYTVTVNYISKDLDDVTNVTRTETTEVIIGGTCSPMSKNLSVWKSKDNKCLEAEIWTCKDIFGYHAGSKSTSYEWIRSKWRTRSGSLSTKINVTFRNGSDCGGIPSDEVDYKNGISVRAVKTTNDPLKFGVDYQDGEVFSNHSLNSNIFLDLVLNPCP